MQKFEVVFTNTLRSAPRPPLSIAGEAIGTRDRSFYSISVNGKPVNLHRVDRTKVEGSNTENYFDITLSLSSPGEAPSVGDIVSGDLADALSDTAWLFTKDCVIVNKWRVSAVRPLALEMDNGNDEEFGDPEAEQYAEELDSFVAELVSKVVDQGMELDLVLSEAMSDDFMQRYNLPIGSIKKDVLHELEQLNRAPAMSPGM
jgi:hypothetical protein